MIFQVDSSIVLSKDFKPKHLKPTTMVTTLLAGKAPHSVTPLRDHLDAYCPQIQVGGMATSAEEAQHFLRAHRPELIFLDLQLLLEVEDSLLAQSPEDFEMVVLYSDGDILECIGRAEAVDYLSRPIQISELLSVVARVQHRIHSRREWRTCRRTLNQLCRQLPPDNQIGIPTMEAMYFLKTEEIIRCEGVQQFTRVILTEGGDIISSYNIGKFHDLLLPYGFFAPHKSHLVNLHHLRKYTVDGTLLMRDGSTVPVSRRRRGAFLRRVNHL